MNNSFITAINYLRRCPVNWIFVLGFVNIIFFWILLRNCRRRKVERDDPVNKYWQGAHILLIIGTVLFLLIQVPAIASKVEPSWFIVVFSFSAVDFVLLLASTVVAYHKQLDIFEENTIATSGFLTVANVFAALHLAQVGWVVRLFS